MRIKTVGCASIVGTLARVWAVGGRVVALDRASVGWILYRFTAPDDF